MASQPSVHIGTRPTVPRRGGVAARQIDFNRLGQLSGGTRRNPAPRWGRGTRRRQGRSLPIALIIIAVAVAGVGGWWYSSPELGVQGLRDGSTISATTLAAGPLPIVARGVGPDVVVTLDGKTITPVQMADGHMAWAPTMLPDGPHHLTVSGPRRFFGMASHTTRFTVDNQAPPVTVDAGVPSAIDSPAALTGITEPGATVSLQAGDQPAETTAGPDGRFRLDLPFPPANAPLTISDAAGNVTTQRVTMPISHPGAHAVHVTFSAWADPVRKAAVLDLIKQARIDTVQLDLKDEGGTIGYDSKVPMAIEIGAVHQAFVLKEAVDELHGLGVRVVVRIVAFRDLTLADWAWEHGHRDWVISTPAGKRFGAYDGAFVNFTRAEVRKYNLDIAREAAAAGVDDVMWDYIRRPEGNPDEMTVPGRGDTPSSVFVASFLQEGQAVLRPAGVYQGAAVFGIAIDRGDSIGQDIPAMAQYLDYVSPMVYPSHWNKGEYGVADPDSQPYDIVAASIGLFEKALEGTNTAIMPWVQGFDSGIAYGPTEIQAEMQASYDNGSIGVFLWNALSVYDADALPPSP